MKRMLGVALLLVIAAAAAPATGKAAPPVRITACEPSNNLMDFDSVGFQPQAWTWAMYGPEDGPYYTFMNSSVDSYEAAVMRSGPTLAVDYVNQTASVIRSIEFGLVTRGHLIAQVQDVGTFSPAMQISHDFRLPNLWIGRGSLTCVPLMVTFSDGTTWNNPDPR